MPVPLPDPLPVCTVSLPPMAKASFTGDYGACTEVTSSLVKKDAGDIVPDGYLALGSAALVEGSDGPFPHGVDLVLPCDLGKAAAGAPMSRIVVVGKRRDGLTTVIPASNIVYEAPYKRLHFRTAELGTFQAAIPKTAGTKIKRHYTFRGIGGVSMGGIGSSMNFWRRPDRYDVIAVMGADPGPDLTYTLGILHDWFFAGFCDAQSGKLGQLCPSPRKPMLDQFEVPMDFEHLIYQKGDGVGLTLRRPLYIRAFRDLSRALGNAAYASDPKSMAAHNTYLPPGVPASTLSLSNAEACSKPFVLKKFFDGRYNPDGSKDVITFCDGGDSDKLGLGVFDASVAQTDPAQIILAVDLNGNGKRDSGEPVILQGSEHYADDGVDGLPDEKEPGYDAKTNPDPNRDDYHWYWNPTGTEKNWRFDKGEKYDDFGVDGVQGKGCPVGSAPQNGIDCYDFGEGNGQFDYAPSSLNWMAHDPRTLLEALPADQLERLDVYYDAGIRDFLNAQVSTNSLMGALHARGQHARIWENGFPVMTGKSPDQEHRFNITDLDLSPFGRHLYVRYGNPDASQAEVEETGEGRHVGTVEQAVHRGQMLFYFVSRAWPDGDTDVDVSPGRTVDAMFTAKNGRQAPYSVVLPPGYDDEKNANRRYPVFYMGHGYGMKPEDLAQVAIVASNAMVNGSVPPERRLQKFIMVFVDGMCRPGGDIKNAPLTMEGDLCEEGIFYAEHPDGSAKAETHLLELQDLVESKYRVRAPADIDVVQ